jgi:hypothetical protein
MALCLKRSISSLESKSPDVGIPWVLQVEKSLQTTYKRMQKSVQRPDVLSTIWNQYFKV